MLRTMISITERDVPAVDRPHHDPGGGALTRFADALLDADLCVDAWREATAAEVAELDSTWAKRLDIPQRRPAWMLLASMMARGD